MSKKKPRSLVDQHRLALAKTYLTEAIIEIETKYKLTIKEVLELLTAETAVFVDSL